MIAQAEVDAVVLEVLLLEVIVALVFTLIIFGTFSWAILRTGKLPHPASLVTALALLTFIALIGAIYAISVNRGAEPLIAIASAGIGAIATAVATTFKTNDPPPPPPFPPPNKSPDDS